MIISSPDEFLILLHCIRHHLHYLEAPEYVYHTFRVTCSGANPLACMYTGTFRQVLRASQPFHWKRFDCVNFSFSTCFLFGCIE